VCVGVVRDEQRRPVAGLALGGGPAEHAWDQRTGLPVRVLGCFGHQGLYEGDDSGRDHGSHHDRSRGRSPEEGAIYVCLPLKDALRSVAPLVCLVETALRGQQSHEIKACLVPRTEASIDLGRVEWLDPLLAVVLGRCAEPVFRLLGQVPITECATKLQLRVDMPTLGSASQPSTALLEVIAGRAHRIHGLEVSRFRGPPVPVSGLVRLSSGEELGETVHRFALAGLSGIVKPPMSLLGIATLEEVGQTHHRP
jgi:hypothetical protein